MQMMMNPALMLQRLDDAELRAVTGGVLTGRTLLTQMRQSLSPPEAIMATVPPPAPAQAPPAEETTDTSWYSFPATQPAPGAETTPATIPATTSDQPPATTTSTDPIKAQQAKIEALNDQVTEDNNVLGQLRAFQSANTTVAVSDLGTTTLADGKTMALGEWLSSHGFGAAEMKDGLVTGSEFGTLFDIVRGHMNAAYTTMQAEAYRLQTML
jgi:hypothetical protein